jgi:phosphonate transport system permease protein
MSVASIVPRHWTKPPLIKRAWLRWALGIGAVVYLALALGTTEVNWPRVWEGLPRGARFFAAFFPPDFSSRRSDIADGILESLWMTVVSTAIGIAISVPVGIGAAKNIAPRPVYYFCRGILAISRSFQEIILAIFFVKLFGFGPFAGVVTLSFATIGFYGKLLAEDIEDMDFSQAEAVRATGAGWLQWINYGIQPQVMPRMIGLGLYRFDINFPRIRRDRHRRRRRHRRDARYRVRPLRISFCCRHLAHHHWYRDAAGIFVRLHSPLGAMMAVALNHGTKVWHRRERRAQFAIWLAWLAAAAIFVYCWQLISDKTIWAFVIDAPAQAADLAVRMVPPDWSFIAKLRRPLWDTINIATLGTAIGIVVAVPVAYAAARNTTPSVALVRPIALFAIVSSRSINSLIWALMLVTILGPGVFAGILAIGFRSIGFCAKLLYEAIEEIDESQVEAVRATGASGAQVTAYGIVPQVLPAFAGILVFRWDINIRESTVLGLVGAGGIGLTLNAAITTLAWTKVSLILLIVIATVVVSEWVSAKVRHAII